MTLVTPVLRLTNAFILRQPLFFFSFKPKTYRMLTVISFVGFTLFVAFFSWYKLRKENLGSKDGYFLGGRSLTGGVIAGAVTVGERAWIGVGAVVRDHLAIGEGAVVAAGAVVVKAVPAHTLVAGVPAAIVRDGVDGF